MSANSVMKIVVSTLVLGTTVIGGSPMGPAMALGTVSEAKAVKAAATAADRAQKAVAKKQFDKAIAFAEAAVAAQPRDAEYRMLLGQAYLNAGRFKSAEASFGDTLTLDPERERAALNLALVQVALGQNGAALKTLADYRDKLPAADFGLATALAGDVDEAVRVLEAASRAPTADAKTRQNLALSYALAGKWANAKVLAVQDLAPADADARLIQWASFAKPTGPADQVSALLGVTAVTDSGQPAQLALATPSKATTEVAQLAPPTPPARATEAMFDVMPAAAPTPAVADTAPKPAFEIAAVVAPAPKSAAVQPSLIKAPDAPAKQAVVRVQRPVLMPRVPLSPAVVNAAFVKPALSLENGRYVVQIGAFTNAAVAENSWARLSHRFALADYDPINAKARVNNASFVRLSVGGFAARADADRVCARIKAQGGKCFVRSVAGDAPAQWVLRGAPKRALQRMAAR